MKRKVIAVTGPTASGKSRLSMDLSDHLPLEIISADSMQVYRYMDIGTDKPSREDRQRVKHHLLDVKDPDEQFSAEEFRRLSEEAIESVCKRGNIPCIVGGTGFYLRALLWNYPLEDAPPDQEFRKEMEKIALEKGSLHLHSCLESIDRVSAQKIHPNDLKRIIRALEYYEATKTPISKRLDHSPKPSYDHTVLAIRRPKEELHQKIIERIDEQFRQGFKEEVENLLKMGYGPTLPSMQGLGYKEVLEHLEGRLTLDECKEKIALNTRRFAKRQLTWFRKEKGIIWIDAGNYKSWGELVYKALDILKQRNILGER